MSYFYDFNLSVEEEARARRIHDEAIVIDIVNMGVGGPTIYQEPELAEAAAALPDPEKDPLDAMIAAWKLPYQMYADGKSDAIKRWWDDAGLTATTVSWMGIDDNSMNAISGFASVVTQCDWLEIAYSAKDIRRIKAQGKHSIFWYCQPQPGYGLSTNLKQLGKA